MLSPQTDVPAGVQAAVRDRDREAEGRREIERRLHAAVQELQSASAQLRAAEKREALLQGQAVEAAEALSAAQEGQRAAEAALEVRIVDPGWFAWLRARLRSTCARLVTLAKPWPQTT